MTHYSLDEIQTDSLPPGFQLYIFPTGTVVAAKGPLEAVHLPVREFVNMTALRGYLESEKELRLTAAKEVQGPVYDAEHDTYTGTYGPATVKLATHIANLPYHESAEDYLGERNSEKWWERVNKNRSRLRAYDSAVDDLAWEWVEEARKKNVILSMVEATRYALAVRVEARLAAPER